MQNCEQQMEGQDMITKEELRSYASRTGLNLGQAELDYFQNIILFILYKEYGNEIVFKGGTAMKKCFGLDRFSEDLDFSCSKSIDAKNLANGLKRFRLDFEMQKDEFDDGMKITLRLKGPLYNGTQNSVCRFIIDFSFRENVMLKPVVKSIGRYMYETPAFDVFVMQEEEILAEKVRAIMSREKARDVYDMRFLIEKGVRFDSVLVKKKLEYYNDEWDPKEFETRIEAKRVIWNSELKPLISAVPDFSEAKGAIMRATKMRK